MLHDTKRNDQHDYLRLLTGVLALFLQLLDHHLHLQVHTNLLLLCHHLHLLLRQEIPSSHTRGCHR